MIVSFVLRLAPDRLLVGEFVGELEVVATGQQALFGSAEDMLALLRSSGSTTVETARPDSLELGPTP